MLFKIFADIDSIDIEMKATEVDDFVNTVINISPTFGGINLEDIKVQGNRGIYCLELKIKNKLNT